MLDPEAAIEPGLGLGGIRIGTAVEDVLAQAEPVRVVEIPVPEGEDPVTIHSFGAIRTWSVHGEIVQVGAFEGYGGKTAEGIGIDSTIEAIAAAYGEVVPMGGEGMIEMPGRPGIDIETTAWEDEGVPLPSARAIQLFVHAVED